MMRSFTRRMLVAVSPVLFGGLLLTAACDGGPGSGPTDGGADAGPHACALGEANCCARSRDCTHLTTTSFTAYCEDNTGACEFLCATPTDCEGADFQPTLCAGNACVCDEGICLVPSCSNNADCGGTGLCIAGSCQSGEAAPDGCVIAPTPIYTQTGTSAALRVYATKSGAYVVADSAFTWASGDGAIAAVDASTGVVTGGANAGSTQITATLGAASCNVAVTNYLAPAAATDVRVIVLDEITREPIVGATVVVQDTTDGSGVGEGTTAADGTATLAGIVANTLNVSVFTDVDATSSAAPNGYAYITAAGITDKDVVMYLPRNAADNKAGGYKGTMTADDFLAIGKEDVHLMLAGTSLPGNFIDLDLNVLVGEMIPTHVKFGSLIDDTMGLPSGLVLGIGSEFFRSDYEPLGIPGLRTGWALGGNLPLQDVTNVLGPAIGGGSSSNLPIGQLLGALLPLFNRLNSAVEPGIVIQEFDRVPGTDGNGATIQIPDFAKFPDKTLKLDTKLALKGIVTIPNLPQLPDGSYLDGAVILAGVLVEGQGLVPLGLTAGLDVVEDTQTPNGVVNDEGSDATPGKAIIRMAPQHGGVEGSRYVIVALALGLNNIGGSGSGSSQALSGSVHFFDGLQWEENISLATSGFLNFAGAAKYVGASRHYTPVTVTGADLYRLAIDNAEKRSWIIYHGDSVGLDLPDPTAYTCGGGRCEDRAAAGANLDAQALNSGGVSASQLFGFNDTNLDGMVDMISSFSTIDVSAN